MTLRLKALRSLRWNYTRKGVWAWLKGRQHCRRCQDGYLLVGRHGDGSYWVVCPDCEGRPRRGYQRILSEPELVIAEQTAMAEGVFA